MYEGIIYTNIRVWETPETQRDVIFKEFFEKKRKKKVNNESEFVYRILWKFKKNVQLESDELQLFALQ